MTQKDKEILNLLRKNFELLDQAMLHLEHSIHKCKQIGRKDHYTFEDMEAYDALGVKLARNSDILFQKIHKYILFILKEDVSTFIDRANLLEKIGVIESAEEVIQIREYRNQLVHEYFPDQIIHLYPETLKFAELLVKIYHSTKNYLLNKNFITH